MLGENLSTVRRIPYFSQAFAAGLVLCVGAAGGTLADSPPGAEAGASAASSAGDAQTSLPQNSFFSSLKQAFNKDFDREVVRGHFDQGSPPNAHRYYCLVDPKTGKRETNGVLGQLVPRPGGMTGIKDSSVSLYRCEDAEKQGVLVTTGYVTGVVARGAMAPAPPAPIVPAPAVPIVPAPQAPIPAAVPALPDTSPDKVDVAGVKLGMSPDEVRAILKSKRLLNYYESSETLGHSDSSKSAMQPMTSGRFVNVIATWTPPPSSPTGDAAAQDGESYEVMFTPVPGRERAMAVVHSVGYSPANAVREPVLDSGLVKKYGGFTAPSDLPGSPTWRFQSAGSVQVGDPCNRRAIFGGLGELNVANAARQNLALKTTVDEFRFQLDHCGVAIVTEDHSMANSGAARDQRIITRFTVTAYSPSIGFEGATTAATLIQMAGDAANKANSPRAKDPIAPNL
jgi:hypothetical protein